MFLFIFFPLGTVKQVVNTTMTHHYPLISKQLLIQTYSSYRATLSLTWSRV